MRRTFVVLFAFVVLVAAACSSDGGDGTSFEVTYDGTECVYEGADTLTAGQVEMRFVNDSDLDVGAGVWGLNDGVSYDDFVAAFAPEADSPPAKGDLDDLVTDTAWLNNELVGQQNRGEVVQTITLTEGTYGVGCARFQGGGPPVETQAVRTVTAQN